MAWRLSAYGGVMAMRVEAQQHGQVDQEPRTSPGPSTRAPGTTRRAGQKVVPISAFMNENPGLIERR